MGEKADVGKMVEFDGKRYWLKEPEEIEFTMGPIWEDSRVGEYYWTAEHRQILAEMRLSAMVNRPQSFVSIVSGS